MREHAHHRPRGGLTLIEVLITTTVLVVALLGMLGSILSSSSLQRDTRDTSLALTTIQDLLEQLHATPIYEVPQKFGVGSYHGTFDVPGLSIVPGEASGQVGSIELILDETTEDAQLGLPRDLNGDGAISTTDITVGRMLLLPARITIRWQGASGVREISVPTMIGRR